MFLTPEEEKLLDGEAGPAMALAMKVLVKVGEVLGAERLVRISRAHVSGISFKNLGEEGLSFLEELAGKGGKVSVPTTINPAGMDLDKWKEMGVSEAFARGQLRVINALTRMGADPLLSCAPYEYLDVNLGDLLGWAESNAVLYANSVLGARSNREGGPLALFEAIAGRAPYMGLLTDEGRKPTILVRVRGEIANAAALGYSIGKLVKKGVPFLVNPPESLRERRELKLFLAAIGAASSIGMVIIEGVTPGFEYRDVSSSLERIELDAKDVEDITSRFRGDPEEADAIALGCPHLSIGELKEILVFLRRAGGRLKRRLLLFTARRAYSSAPSIVHALRDLGAEVYLDTCMVVADLSGLGIDGFVVDSAKAAYYLSAQGYDVTLLSRNEALALAVRGRL